MGEGGEQEIIQGIEQGLDEAAAGARDGLRAAYDDQLREAPEMAGADEVDRDGPLWIGRFGDRGFVSYRDLGGLEGEELEALVARTVARFAADERVTSFEWKTRGHDAPPELPEVLTAAGLVAEPVETVMVGLSEGVAAGWPASLPDGVEVCRVDHEPEADAWMTRAAVMQAQVFGGGPTPEQVIARQRQRADSSEFWVARVGDQVVCAGRLELVEGTAFAGLWGGATVPEWRGKGLYRALAAGRARSALARGATHLHSDCTDMSRPILERAGLVAVTTTTPYVWTRA